MSAPIETIFTNALMIALGVFFMIMAFIATGFRGALSKLRGPAPPISTTGRVILFIAGLVATLTGLNRLLTLF